MVLCPHLLTGLTIYRIIHDLEEWLKPIDLSDGGFNIPTDLRLDKKKWPGIKDLWKAGDLRETMVATNAKISNIRSRWQVWGSLVLTADCLKANSPDASAILHACIDSRDLCWSSRNDESPSSNDVYAPARVCSAECGSSLDALASRTRWV